MGREGGMSKDEPGEMYERGNKVQLSTKGTSIPLDVQGCQIGRHVSYFFDIEVGHRHPRNGCVLTLTANVWIVAITSSLPFTRLDESQGL